MNFHDDNPRTNRPPSPDIEGRGWAWFLDVDGTLLEIETRPDLVIADTRLLDMLDRLNKANKGAVALISGRSLDQLDGIFGQFRLAAAGSHGIEQRFMDGTAVNKATDLPPGLVSRIVAFAEQYPDLLLERKPFSIGVHYRNRPELETTVLEAMEKINAELDNVATLMRGKMLVEVLPTAANKGSAIRSFMRTSPFAGRLPVFIGDDVTDEHGFAVVNEMDGMSIRIGDAAGSAATWQLESVADLRAWLEATLDRR
ncbi:MAG TPA: trehalose-phosphatase [Woeseiaceae bacterium]|nr:trehalose-phosphatase [Woeseiaceae bacterium]